MKFPRFLLPLSFLLPVAASTLASTAAAAPDLRFGAMTHFAQGWDPVWADIAALRGITTVRDELYWESVEPAKGVFVFPHRFDAYMETLRRLQISPLIVLSFENRLYDNGDTPHSAEGMAAFARYGTEVLKHYGASIQAVEIWNEYNGTFCRGPATADRAGTYAKMLREAYGRIKSLRPDVTVLGGSTAGVPMPYWEKLMQNGALQSMDALSIHPYRYDAPPEGLEKEIAALQELVKKYNGGQPKPIWVTEIGWSTQTAAQSGGLVIDEATQAKFLVRAYALLLSAKVERVYWYLLRDYDNFTMGLTSADATPKLAAFALQVMARELSSAPFVRREATSSGLYSLLFVRPSGEEIRVMWALEPTRISAAGVTRVTDLEGRVRAPSAELALNDAPVFVEGRLTGLPVTPTIQEVELADSRTGFSNTQGGNGWSFGEAIGATGAFQLLPNYSVSDWNAAWGSSHAYLSITPNDQHPSVAGNGVPVSVIRRWTSDREATVRVSGEFRCGPGGDGVGAAVRVNGQQLFRHALGGGNAVSAKFDFEQKVAPGTTIDFAVDPGPAGDISFDATQVQAVIQAR